MIHQPEYVKELLKKHIGRTASAYEEEMLMLALDLYEVEELAEMIEDISPGINFNMHKDADGWKPNVRDIIERSREHSIEKPKHPILYTLSIAALYATTITLIVFLIWMFTHKPKLEYLCGTGNQDKNEILAGVNKCRLILDNGCVIILDSSYKGFVTKQGNTEVIKSPAGILEYKPLSEHISPPDLTPAYNTISTSRGAHHRILLPDGSKVTLNAASSIRFPVVFPDNARPVEIDGEAYFEVAKNPDAPFYVMAKNARIKAIGTSFNVNAYSSDILTTLISGQMEIRTASDSALVNPGQQAIVRQNAGNGNFINNTINVQTADTIQILSWQKSKRIFIKTDIRDFLMEMGRRYDLEMINTERIPQQYFSGTLCYDTPVSEILKLLRSNGLNFIQHGNKIIFSLPGK